jgi:ABC-type Fe3+/spermidine/putrescine transport system ATPase subunit
VLIMRARPEQGEGGWIEQEGTPAQVYRYPQTEYVARFLGFRNLLAGEVIEAGDGYRVRSGIGELAASDGHGRFAAGDKAVVLIRPEAANLRTRGEEAQNVINGRLLSASFRGSYYLVELKCPDGAVLICEVSASAGELPEVGEALSISLDPGAIVLLRPEPAGANARSGANVRSSRI